MSRREDYLRDVIGPLVDELRESYALTQNPDVHKRMSEAIQLYDAKMADLAADETAPRP